MSTCCSRPSQPWAACDCITPAYLGCLNIVGDHVVQRSRLPRLCDGQRPCMPGKEGRGDGGEHQAGQHRDGQDVLLDLLAALGFGGTEDDALDLVVYAAACLEGVRVGVSGEVVEVGLEQPEGEQGAVDGLFAQIYYEFLQGHRLVVDANEEVT